MEWSKRYGGDDWDFGNNIVASKVDSNHFFIIGQTYSYGNLNGNGLILKISSLGLALVHHSIKKIISQIIQLVKLILAL